MRNYTYSKTSNPQLYRVVDMNGDWKHYAFFSKKNQKGDKIFLRAVNFILSQGYAKPRLNDWFKNHTAEEAERILSERGERGDRVHQGIFLFLRDGKITRDTQVLAEDNKTLVRLSADEFDCILSFVAFWNAHRAVLAVQDYAVFNLKAGYAGTLDAIIKLTATCENKYCKCKEVIGQTGLWDWKSSGDIYPDYGAQVAAYAGADNLPKKVKIEYTAILRVGTNHKVGFEIELYGADKTAVHLQEFFSAMVIQNASYKEFMEENIKEIPDEAVAWNVKKPKAKKKR